MNRHALKYCAVLYLIATASFGQELSWLELARRPELWPADCVAKAEMKFDGGVTIRPGQKLTVLKVEAAEVQVRSTDGRTTFTAEPDETDVLAVAQAAYARLTPKQRALTYEVLARQKEIWPQHVTITRGFDLAPGKSVRSGEKVTVVEVMADRVAVKSDSLKANFQVAVQATDLMAEARKLVEDEKAVPRFVDVKKEEAAQQVVVEQKKQTHGPVLTELEPDLVSSVTGKPAPFDPHALPRYIVLFRGSSTCPITREFAPTLIKYYQQMKPRHPEFEIVYMMTETPEATSKFARELGFSWRAIPYQHSYMPTVSQPIKGLLPQLVVMDRNGRVLANGWQSSAPNALKQLDALLRTSPAARP